MIYIIILLAAICALAAYMLFEAGWLQVGRKDFSNGAGGFKILHLSDIHIDYLKVPVEKILGLIAQEDPDTIVITGDCLNHARKAPDFLNFIMKIKSELQKLKGERPILLCPGNHEYKAFRRNSRELAKFLGGIEKAGVKVLVNNPAVVDKGNKKYFFIGLDDYREGRPDYAKASKGCPAGATRIVLAHNPDQVLKLPSNEVDYFFCGHFHGGQIRVPFRLELYIRRKDVLDKKGYVSGFFSINGIKTYISRGVGNVLLPMRFLARPEISVYTIP
jgi:predicted MPP superfamily phosphohydrolase